MANQFTYFTYLLFFVLLLYIVVLSVFLCLRRSEIKQRSENEMLATRLEVENEGRFSFSWTTVVADVTTSSFGPAVRPLLLTLRIIGFIFILVSPVSLSAYIDNIAFYYFDGWSIILAFLYYTGVTILTGMAIYVDHNRTPFDLRLNGVVYWSYYPTALAVCCHLLYEVTGASIIASIFIDMQEYQVKSTILYNQTLAVFGLLVLDMIFNDIRVRFDQLPAAIAWLLIYFISMWPAVFTGSVKDWPYRMMRTDSTVCFGNYTLIVFGMMVAYTMWYSIYKFKKLLMHFYVLYRDRDLIVNDEAVALAEISLAEQDERVEEESVQNALHASSRSANNFYDPNTSYYNQYGYDSQQQLYDPNASQYYMPANSQSQVLPPYPPHPYLPSQYSMYSDQSQSQYSQSSGQMEAGGAADQQSLLSGTTNYTTPYPYPYPYPYPPTYGQYPSGYPPYPPSDQSQASYPNYYPYPNYPPQQPYYNDPNYNNTAPPPLDEPRSSESVQESITTSAPSASTSQGNNSGKKVNPLHRRRPSPGNSSNPAHQIPRTPTTLFGDNADADLSAFAFGFNEE